MLTLYEAIIASLSDKIVGTCFLNEHPYLQNFLNYYDINPMTFAEKAELLLVVIANY